MGVSAGWRGLTVGNEIVFDLLFVSGPMLSGPMLSCHWKTSATLSLSHLHFSVYYFLRYALPLNVSRSVICLKRDFNALTLSVSAIHSQNFPELVR